MGFKQELGRQGDESQWPLVVKRQLAQSGEFVRGVNPLVGLPRYEDDGVIEYAHAGQFGQHSHAVFRVQQ